MNAAVGAIDSYKNDSASRMKRQEEVERARLLREKAKSQRDAVTAAAAHAEEAFASGESFCKKEDWGAACAGESQLAPCSLLLARVSLSPC